jgi:branched-chain amino acid transport system ATP-binding protein
VRVRRSLAETLDRFEILGRNRSRAAGTLSGGEQQVLSIARALMARPRLLVLDEPSMGLAPLAAREVFDLVGQVHADGVTILLIEKRARLVQQFAQRLYVMELGRVVASGPAGELAGDRRIEDAYLGRNAWDDPVERGQ